MTVRGGCYEGVDLAWTMLGVVECGWCVGAVVVSDCDRCCDDSSGGFVGDELSGESGMM